MATPFSHSNTKYSEFNTPDEGSGSGGGGRFTFREVILASVVIPPQVVPIVPCETTFLGELPTASNGITGRVYLLNRLTFAILGFSYDGQAEGMTCLICMAATIMVQSSLCRFLCCDHFKDCRVPAADC